MIEWVDSVRYLSVYFVSGRFLKCNWDHAKSSSYRSFNAIFGRISQFASVETIMYLMESKYMPILVINYDIKACQVYSSDM